MKKAFVHALCALTLAVPATAAEKIFVPVMGTTAVDGSALATKVWVTDAEGKGLLRPAAAREESGLLTLEADETQDVSAWMVGGAKVAAEVPVFTERETYSPGVDVPLAGLTQKAMASLQVGAANMSDKTAYCSATLYARNGNVLAEVPFEVAPRAFTQENVLPRAGKARLGEVRVTCDQTFYPVGAATERANRRMVFAKASGPNAACNYTLSLTRQPSGAYGTPKLDGVFHGALRNNPKGVVCIKAPATLNISKAIFEWESTVGPWYPRNQAGLHNLAYIFLERYRGGTVGNANAAGPNKSFIKLMQNVGMPRGTNTNVKAGFDFEKGKVYRFVYTYDAANKIATLQTLLNNVTVNQISAPVRPGNNQTLVVKPYTQDNLAMVAEFGNFNNQHAPEVPSWEWKFSNFSVFLLPK
jgi:hypothetical protein